MSKKTGVKKEILIKQFEELEKIHRSLGNIYEARAYNQIVESLMKYPENTIKSSSELKGLKGIGNRTLLKIDEILKSNGKISLLEELRKNPAIQSRLELQQILGIGPKQAERLVVQQNIHNIKELKEKVNSGKIILTHLQELGLKYYRDLNKVIPRSKITEFGKYFQKILMPMGFQTILAGSYRRGKMVSGDIDIILVNQSIKTADNLTRMAHRGMVEKLANYLKEKGVIIDIITMHQNGLSAIINVHFYRKTGGKTYIRQMDLRIAPANLLPFFLLYFGSGEKFSRYIRSKAKEKGMKLSEWGLNNVRKVKNEREIFRLIGVPYVIPEDR